MDYAEWAIHTQLWLFRSSPDAESIRSDSGFIDKETQTQLIEEIGISQPSSKSAVNHQDGKL
jgi:hypothetical protein